MAASVISRTKQSLCVDLSFKTIKCDSVQFCFQFMKIHPGRTTERPSVVPGIVAAAQKFKVLKIFLSLCGFGVCHYNEEITPTPPPPCVIWPFHLLCINQMWLDSLHKFPWRVMTLISSLWKRSVVVGWFMKQVLLVKYLGKSASTLSQVLLWGSAPGRRQLINRPCWLLCTADSSVILVLDNGNEAEGRLRPGCCPYGKEQTLWEGRAIVVISKWMTTKI